uniref:Solute carrier family 49 member 4 n=1 Tax=Podarcis muralis TaxID=64176 RepID=A0A670KBI3_PODMU|nr:solute carrier family 49 member 4 [Podarcis muralis]
MGSDWSSPEEREPLLQPPPAPAALPQHYPAHGQPRRTAAASRAAAPRSPGLVPAAPPRPPPPPLPGRVYGRRWLVLLLFSLLGFAQGLVWNTWGPIQNSARQAFPFSKLDIALLVFWGPIGFVPCFFFMWLMDKKGLRVTMLLTSSLMVVGAGLRCVPVSDQETRKCNPRFLMIALAYAIPLGVFSGWSGVLDLILTPKDISQVDAGWIGFWSIVGGCIVGIALARFADFIRGMLKLILLLLLSGATLSSIWFTLTCLTTVSHLPLTTATLYTSGILFGVFLNSSVPIFFELFVETVYPVPEGITCGVTTFLSNMFMGVLLFFLTFYNKEFSWFNWCLPGSCLLSLLLILCFRESYDRLYLDVIVSV